MDRHVRILSALYIGLGVVGLFAAFFWSLAMGALAAIVGSSPEEGAGVGAALLGFNGFALSIFFIALSIPSIVCGWGLAKRRRWSRILGIILAAIALVKLFPLWFRTTVLRNQHDSGEIAGREARVGLSQVIQAALTKPHTNQNQRAYGDLRNHQKTSASIFLRSSDNDFTTEDLGEIRR